jgi:hypothetical protein
MKLQLNLLLIVRKDGNTRAAHVKVDVPWRPGMGRRDGVNEFSWQWGMALRADWVQDDSAGAFLWSMENGHPFLDEHKGAYDQHGETLPGVGIPGADLGLGRFAYLAVGNQTLHCFIVVTGHFQRGVCKVDAVIHQDQAAAFEVRPQPAPVGLVNGKDKFFFPGQHGDLLHNARVVSGTGDPGVLFQFQLKALSSLARRRLLNVLPVRLRRLLPRRLDIIFDLKLELPCRRLHHRLWSSKGRRGAIVIGGCSQCRAPSKCMPMFRVKRFLLALFSACPRVMARMTAGATTRGPGVNNPWLAGSGSDALRKEEWSGAVCGA